MLKKIGSMVFLLIIFTSSVNTGWSEEKLRQIVCIGDQITKGQIPQEMIGNGTRWVDRVAALDNKLEIINAGVEGLKSGEVKYLNDVLTKYPAAQLYIIYLGINDLIDVKTIDSGVAASVGAKILRMIDKIKSVAVKAEIAVVAPQRVDANTLSDEWVEKGFGEHTEVLSDLISASIEVAANKRGVRFIDLIDKIDTTELINGVEPNMKGHAKIAKIIWDEISYPQIVNKDIQAVANIAPPPVGRKMLNEKGTADIIEGVEKDIASIEDMGSSLETPVEVVGKKSLHVKNYINENLSKDVITKTAYLLGKNIAKQIIKTTINSMEAEMNALMEAEFANLDSGVRDSANAVEIVYKLPEESRVESFITEVAKNKGEYGVLAEAVDWASVKVDKEKLAAINYENKIVREQKEVIEKSVKEKISEITEEDIVAENKEIIELWLPEFDVLDGKDSAVELVDGKVVAEVEELQKMVNTEVKEVFAATEPIEYTGYAVFVHTSFSE